MQTENVLQWFQLCQFVLSPANNACKVQLQLNTAGAQQMKHTPACADYNVCAKL